MAFTSYHPGSLCCGCCCCRRLRVCC
jgi:hypothetical protein